MQRARTQKNTITFYKTILLQCAKKIRSEGSFWLELTSDNDKNVSLYQLFFSGLAMNEAPIQS